jgi:hypothetical protein
MRSWLSVGVLCLAGCGPPKRASAHSESTQTAEDGDKTGQVGSDESTDTEDSDSDAADDGRVFIGDWDIPTQECTVFDQDCPDGEKCIPTTSSDWGIYKCVPINGDKGVGESCFLYEGQADDGDANSHCANAKLSEEGYVGTCIPLCQGEPYENAWCPGQGESCDDFRCVFFGQDAIPFCVQTCDPYLGGCEDEGLNCHYESGYVNDFICMVRTVEAQLGEPCDWTNDCTEGLYCVNAEYLPSCSDYACCTPYCEMGDDAGCHAQVPGTGCYGPLIWGEPAPEECSQVGVCTLEW